MAGRTTFPVAPDTVPLPVRHMSIQWLVGLPFLQLHVKSMAGRTTFPVAPGTPPLPVRHTSNQWLVGLPLLQLCGLSLAQLPFLSDTRQINGW